MIVGAVSARMHLVAGVVALTRTPRLLAADAAMLVFDVTDPDSFR